MKNDKLKQFVSLRTQLMKDKAELEARLAEINKALGAVSALSTPAAPEKVAVRRGRPPGKAAAGAASATVDKTIVRRRGVRLKNAMSLKEAVLTVTKAKPMSRPDILKDVLALGYKFKTKDPLNSLGTLLYSDKAFKNNGGIFGPA
jgi:hypothetical protein